MNRWLVMGLLLLLSVPGVGAADSSKRESVEELMSLMDMDSLLDGMYVQMESVMLNTGKELGIEPAEQPVFDKFMSRYIALIREEMSWQKMKDPMIDIYQKNFSEKEIQDMLVFYKSDTGRSVIEKMPLVMQDSISLTQTMMKDFYPRIEAMMGELKEEIRVQREKAERAKSKKQQTL